MVLIFRGAVYDSCTTLISIPLFMHRLKINSYILDDNSTLQVRHYVISQVLLYIGIFLLPLLAWFDYQNGIHTSAIAKIITAFVALVAIILSGNRNNCKWVIEVTAIFLLLMAVTGAFTKMHLYSLLVWVPVLPVLFFYLASLKLAFYLNAIYLICYMLAWSTYEFLSDNKPIEFLLWLQSILAFSITFLLSYYYRYHVVQHDRQLRNSADCDFLTGALNRRGIEPTLVTEMQRTDRYGTDLCLILMDLDHFKNVNDTLGHQAGDQLLASVANIITANIRRPDSFARWGGEEFLILAPGLNQEQGVELAEKLRTVIENTEFSSVVDLTASFGVQQYRPGQGMAELYSQIDSKLYDAKHQGRNCVIS